MSRYNRFIPNLTREDGSAFEQVMEGRMDRKEDREEKKNPRS